MGFPSQFRNLQFRDPTLQYLQHVIIVGILSHCYDFFPFPLPCTNRYVQHMTQLGILSHFWNIPPSNFQYFEQIWTNGVNWHVESESSIFFALPTLHNNIVEPTKLSSQVISKIYPPPDPTRQYIQHIQPTWHLESCLKCFFLPCILLPWILNTLCNFFAPPTPHKTIHLKEKQNFYLEFFFPTCQVKVSRF